MLLVYFRGKYQSSHEESLKAPRVERVGTGSDCPSEGSGPGKCSCCKTGVLWGQRKLNLILTIEYAVVIEDDPADGGSEAGVATVSAMLIIQGYNKCKRSYDRLRFFTAPHMYRNPVLSSSPPCPSSTISR
jgi:hypothetical protein